MWKMFSLLKKIHDKAEEYKGKRLLVLLSVIFVAFSILGILLGYFIGNNPQQDGGKTATANKLTVLESYYEGKITYVDPNYYPNDKITYFLADGEGNEVLLLKALDQKLEVSEGHFAKVYGKITKTKDNSKDVLLVDKVVISSPQ